MPDFHKSDKNPIVKGCLSKNVYESLTKATFAAHHGMKRGPRRLELYAYKCLFDDHYHIAHKKNY